MTISTRPSLRPSVSATGTSATPARTTEAAEASRLDGAYDGALASRIGAKASPTGSAGGGWKLRAASALLLASAPLARAKPAQTATPAQDWQPAPQGPTYPDPIWDNPFGRERPVTEKQVWRDPNCWSYAKNDPRQERRDPGNAQLGRMGPMVDCDKLVYRMRLEGARDPQVADGCDSVCAEDEHLVHARVRLPMRLGDGQMLPGDYHFWRKDVPPDGMPSPGRFSHKPGIGLPTHLDGAGRPIDCPEKSDLKGFPGGLPYAEDCGYFCVEGPRSTASAEPADPAEASGQASHQLPILGAAIALGGAAALALRQLAPRAQAAPLTAPERGVLDRLGEGAALSQSALRRQLRGTKLPEIKAALQSLSDRGFVETNSVDGVEKHRLTAAGRKLRTAA